jgi:hypothetical protein
METTLRYLSLTPEQIEILQDKKINPTDFYQWRSFIFNQSREMLKKELHEANQKLNKYNNESRF